MNPLILSASAALIELGGCLIETTQHLGTIPIGILLIRWCLPWLRTSIIHEMGEIATSSDALGAE